MAKYEVIISTEKKDEHSFLVALIPALSIPREYDSEEEIHITECAVIAANHGNNGGNKWAYVHLESDEKQAIGNSLVAHCAKMNEWYWCNLYVDLGGPLDNLPRFCPNCGVTQSNFDRECSECGSCGFSYAAMAEGMAGALQTEAK